MGVCVAMIYLYQINNAILVLFFFCFFCLFFFLFFFSFLEFYNVLSIIHLEGACLWKNIGWQKNNLLILKTYG